MTIAQAATSQAGSGGRPEWRREALATLALAWPLILTNLAQSGIGTINLLYLGRLGANTLAAAALATNFQLTAQVLGFGVLLACSPMIARAIGEKSYGVRDVRRTVRQTLWVAMLLCLPLWLLMWNGEAVLLALGQQPHLAEDAGHMLRVMMWGLLPMLGYVVLRSFIAALQRPGWSLVIAGSAVLINIGLAHVLIFGGLGVPAMGLIGAGISALLASCWLFLGLAIVVTRDRQFRRYHLFGHFWRADWGRFRAIWRIGLPIGITTGMEALVFNAAVVLMGLISEAALAAHAIAIQIAMLAFMVPLGLGNAATIRVGHARGRRDDAAITRAGWCAWLLGVVFMSMTALLMVTVPRLLIGGFIDVTDPANAAVVALAISFLAIGAIFQIVDGAQVVAAGMLRGLQDTAVPMLFAFVGYWVIGISVGSLLAFRGGWGGVGIWIGLATGLGIVATLMTGRWMLRDRIGLTRR